MRTLFELINDAVPSSPHRGIHVGTARSDAYICTTPEVEDIVPAHNHYFVNSPPAISGARFRINLDTIQRILPTRTIWAQDQIFMPELFRAEGFNEAYRPLGWHHCTGVIFHELREYFGYFGVWRSVEQRPFSTEDIEFLRASSPHITHGLKTAQLLRQGEAPNGDLSFEPLAEWEAGSVLIDQVGRLLGLDAQARRIFQQVGMLDGISANAFQLPQLREAFDYIARTLREIFRDPDSGLSAAGPPVARVYAHWSGIVLKLRGCRMAGADGREYTTVIVERGETAEARRRRMIARWGLSPREGEVLDFIIASKTGPEIAILLSLSHDTVRKHTSSILAKLGAETRAAAASAVRNFI